MSYNGVKGHKTFFGCLVYLMYIVSNKKMAFWKIPKHHI